MKPDLSLHIADIAHHILGEHNRSLSTRRQLRFGNNGSIAVEIAGPKRGTWFDHENGVGGGPLDLVRIKAGLDNRQAQVWLRDMLGIETRPKANGSGSSKQRVVKAYDYHDEQGRLLFQVVRRGPRKIFHQQAPDGKGGLKRGKNGKLTMEGVRLVPYRFPELLAATANRNGKPSRIYITEGEKDADALALLGLTATTNPMGAGKWRNEFNGYFSGVDVVILPDANEVGRKHAQVVAANLAPIAASVRILELGGLPEKGDVSDWIDAGGTQSDLETLVEITPPLDPHDADNVDDDDDKPLDLGEWDFGEDNEPVPPRGWLIGNLLCRQFLSAIFGDGAVGKTAVMIAMALSLATGRELIGEHVFVQCAVLMSEPRKRPAPLLERIAFKTSRLAEFCGKKELVAQTDIDDWPVVILKELLDNALDAAEEAEIALRSIVLGSKLIEAAGSRLSR